MRYKKSEKLRWSKPSNAVECSKSNVKSKSRLLRSKKTKILLNSGESATRSFNWPNNKRRKRRDKELRNWPPLYRSKMKQSKRSKSRSSKKEWHSLWKRRPCSINKKRISILMPNNASLSGKARARMSSLLSWSLRITRSALFEGKALLICWFESETHLWNKLQKFLP